MLSLVPFLGNFIIKTLTMKKAFFLFYTLLLLLVQAAYAQNYALITPNQEKHFTGLSNVNTTVPGPLILSIRIDSTQPLSNQTIYKNYPVFTPPTNSSNCQLTFNDSSWIGHQIIAYTNGDYLFFNRDHDSILIKTSANVNDTWTLYTFPNQDYIEASVTSISPVSVLGNMDSVKTIQLQVKDNLNNPITHPFNNKAIKCSKNYGLTQFYYIPDFPLDTNTYSLVGSNTPNAGTVNLTADAIFDYDIGDVFHTEDHYRSDFSPWMYRETNIRQVVLGKAVSGNQDTLRYSIARCINEYTNNTMTPTPDTTITVDTITTTIVLSEYAFLNKLTHEINNDSSGYVSFFMHPQINRRAKGTIRNYYRAGPNCWQAVIGTPAPFTTYIEGLGGGYYNNPNLFIGEDRYELVYYAKNGVTWGTPLNLDCNIRNATTTVAASTPTISVYPVPASDEVTLYVENFNTSEHWQLELYHITGKIVYTQPITTPQTVLKKASLPSGIYVYKLQDLDGAKNYTGKIIFR